MVGSGAAAHILSSSSPLKTSYSYSNSSRSRHRRDGGTTFMSTTSFPRVAVSAPMMMMMMMKPQAAGISCAPPLKIEIRRRQPKLVVSASAANGGGWFPVDIKKSDAPSVSDIVWPSLGAFGAMALLGKIDQMVLASRGMSMSIAPIGAVCAVLFLTPSAPAARKYNMFMAQIGCAAIGVFVYSLMGPGWAARSVSLSLSIAFMIITRCNHPPAAGLPLLYIDGAKFHHLSYWFAVFPAAFACIILAIIQEMVCFLKENVKF